MYIAIWMVNKIKVMKRNMILIFSMLLLICLFSYYLFPRIKAYIYFSDAQYLDDKEEMAFFYWSHFYVFNELLPLDDEVYRNARNKLNYKAWPLAVERFLDFNPFYITNSDSSTFLCAELRPSLYKSNDIQSVTELGFLDFLFSQQTIIIDTIYFDTLIFPNRYSDVFMTKSGFEVNDNLKLKRSIKRDLRIYSDYIIFNNNLKRDIPNFIKYKICDTCSNDIDVILGEKCYFEENSIILSDFVKIFSIYNDIFTDYDEIYFDLGLYPSRLDSIPDIVIEKRRQLANDRISYLLKLSK